MIINEMAGSGGDLMPYMFKHRKIGPLVGKRTWGGLVATSGHAAVRRWRVDDRAALRLLRPRRQVGGGERRRRAGRRRRELAEGRRSPGAIRSSSARCRRRMQQLEAHPVQALTQGAAAAGARTAEDAALSFG